MTWRRRLHLRAHVIERPVELDAPCRHPDAEDCESLGSLMLHAYQGTIDERHRTAADASDHIAKYFAGEFGEPLLDCSYMALEADRPISATLVTLGGDDPLLAQVYTSPDRQNAGLASALIQLSMNSLAARGLAFLTLVVTDGNLAALHVYRKFGFHPMG